MITEASEEFEQIEFKYAFNGILNDRYLLSTLKLDFVPKTVMFVQRVEFSSDTEQMKNLVLVE